MSTNILKWLHLSDFHTGKDKYGQIQLFESIIEHINCKIKSNREPLDMIFITGDIANEGAKSEYKLFSENFILPLYDILGDSTKIFMVPGNHDVDRSEARATKRYGIQNEIPEFFDTDEQGLHERKVLFPRIENYVQSDIHEWVAEGSKWLLSKEGYFTYVHEIENQKIGILGINTAWLSEGDNDRHHLTPGKAIIETGLKKLEACKFKIVLGHHPLDWYDEDVTPIRSIFGKNGVIYLHGHLHKNSGNQEFGAGLKFLTIQSGASFRARENEKWINRLLWCQLDMKSEQVNVHPLQWSKEYQEWAPDGLAYPAEYRTQDTDYCVLPLKERTLKKNSLEDDASVLPQGWIRIDDSFLKQKRSNLSDEIVLSFFDGRVPSWREALTPKIPRRNIVHELIKEMNYARKGGELRVSLILGAGGEGKSTILLQTISDLAVTGSGWKILWLSNPTRDILWPNRFLNQLPIDEDTWLIASDDADLVAKYIFESVKLFHKKGRRDIQFLLCCRDSDWLATEAHEWQWKDHVTTYVEKRLRGISLEDSELIIKGWSQYGTKGLGTLSGLDIKEAASRLYYASKSEEVEYETEGAFLGAMLRVRIGNELKTHVKALLLRLKERNVSNDTTLMDAFAYIAAMHSEQLFILTKEIVSEVLNCKLSDVKKKITGPLGDEAAASTGGDRIYTRHRAIAKAAVEILSETFHVDFDEIFLELSEAAFRIHCEGIFIPYFVQWKFLSEHFLRQGNTALAIRLDQALIKIDPSDSRLIVHCARLLREAKQEDLSLKIFRDLDHGISGPIRSFYYEWGINESINNNIAFATYLFGFSLSDQIEMKPIENRTATMCLSALARNFYSLYTLYNDRIFIQASGAAAQIGYKFPSLNETDKKLFGINQNKSRTAGVNDVDINVAFKILHRGITLAWNQKEITFLPSMIKYNNNELTFNSLAHLIGIENI